MSLLGTPPLSIANMFTDLNYIHLQFLSKLHNLPVNKVVDIEAIFRSHYKSCFLQNTERDMSLMSEVKLTIHTSRCLWALWLVWHCSPADSWRSLTKPMTKVTPKRRKLEDSPNLNIFCWVPKVLFDKVDVLLYSTLFGVKRSHKGGKLGQKFCDRSWGCTFWMGSNQPWRPWGGYRTNLYIVPILTYLRRIWTLTKRTSPASTNGLVVNHSHMNALVELSFTESMSPRMSLFTDTR